jgi:hypothetical protein|tara:strand:- start:130 stop:753 length:624 start_codon:yes stop_codon:yes gene_type:complete
VKEQSFLLQAKESAETSDIFAGILDLINAVTNGTVDANKLPIADLEYLFLQIRSKSIGESVTLPLVCQTDVECDGIRQVEINLSEIEVDTSGMQDNKVKLNDNLIVELQPPLTKLVVALDKLDEADTILPVLRECMVRLYDDENVFELSEYRDSEINEFIESLTVTQFEKISEYFDSVPTLKHNVEWVCPKCKQDSSVVLEGLNNFF